MDDSMSLESERTEKGRGDGTVITDRGCDVIDSEPMSPMSPMSPKSPFYQRLTGI
jgi:hypothetical protein